MKIGFNDEKYLKEQTKAILDRVAALLASRG